MRAARYERLGPAAEVLSVVELDNPYPAPGEVRVRLSFSGVNPTDWKRRLAGPLAPGPTQIPNQDGAGVIDAVGSGVDPERVGERVWVFHGARNRTAGTAAGLVCVPSVQAVPLPDHISLELGASLGIPYITAHAALTGDGSVAGSTVLVTGGGGAVGHAAVELGTFLGADVIATASTPGKAQSARTAGAREVLDYRAAEYPSRLRHAAPAGVDRIVEVALGANIAASLSVLNPGGAIVAYASEATDPALPVRALMTLNARVNFMLVYTLSESRIRAAVDDITEALARGHITALPTTVLPLTDIVAAHDLVESGAFGRVLLDVSDAL